jgi:hypothetical protein
MDGAAFQACLEDRLPGNSIAVDEEAIDKCVEELTSAAQEATAALVPRHRPHYHTRPPIPDSIQDEISLKKRLRMQWQITREPSLKAQINYLQWSATYQLNEWRKVQWRHALESSESEEQLLWKVTKRVKRFPTSLSPLQVPGAPAV